MKIWTVILIVAGIGLIVFLMRQHERFSSSSTPTTCPAGTELIGDTCESELMGTPDDFGGECPEGTSTIPFSMGIDEGYMCQRRETPICGAGYVLTIEGGVAMCEPKVEPPPTVVVEEPPPPPTVVIQGPAQPPREVVFQSKITGLPKVASVLPADTRSPDLVGGLYSPVQ